MTILYFVCKILIFFIYYKSMFLQSEGKALSNTLYEFGNDILIQSADTGVCIAENVCFRVLVYCNDNARLFDTCNMLYRSAYADSYVDLRTNCLACLSYLSCIFGVSVVYYYAAASPFGFQSLVFEGLCEFFYEFEVVACGASSACNYYISLEQRCQTAFATNCFEYTRGVGIGIKRRGEVYHFARTSFYTFGDGKCACTCCRYLRVYEPEYRCQLAFAVCRAAAVQYRAYDTLILFVDVVAYLESRTVGCNSRPCLHTDTGGEFATCRSGGKERYLGFVLFV